MGGQRRARATAGDIRFRGRLDEPVAGTVLLRGLNHVGGWAVHARRRLVGVVVTVDGRPSAFVSEFHERNDVTERWSGQFADTAGAGWSTTLDLSSVAGDEVIVSAYAVLEPGPRPAEDAPRLGKVRHLGTVRCQVRGEVAHFHRPPFLDAGFSRVEGVVRTAHEVGRVELYRDGEPVGPMRLTPVPELRHGRLAFTTRFDSVFEVPAEAATVTLTASVELLDGTTVEVAPWTPEVRTTLPPARPDAARCAIVRSRTDERLAALARGIAPDGERVLVTTHDLNLGGGQLYLHELMLRLARRGVRFALTSPRSGVLVDELEAMGVPVLVTGPTPVQDPEAYEAHVALIGAWAVQHGCTTALANTMLAFTGADAAVRLGLPLTWAIHESYALGRFWTEAHGIAATHPYVMERAERSLRAAGRVVFEAAETQRLFAEHLSPGVGVVVPYGVDLDGIAGYRDAVDRRALRAELGLGADTRTLLCLGTIEPRKGQLGLAQAFARSRRLRDLDIELVCVGAVPGSAQAEELGQVVAGLGDRRIRVEPVQPDVYRWYHASDVLVCASDVESLPRTMLEAMAFGRPVASTAVFGIPELVEDGVSGWLCGDRDLGALRQMLERVGACSPQDLAAMGARAREVVTSRHDPAVYERYYLDRVAGALGAAVVAGGDER